jgi:hypothetical protein
VVLLWRVLPPAWGLLAQLLVLLALLLLATQVLWGIFFPTNVKPVESALALLLLVVFLTPR